MNWFYENAVTSVLPLLMILSSRHPLNAHDRAQPSLVPALPLVLALVLALALVPASGSLLQQAAPSLLLLLH